MWNLFHVEHYGGGSVCTDVQPGEQLVELVQARVVNDQSPLTLLRSRPDLNAEPELAGEGLFEILEVSGRGRGAIAC